jgi:hypothetical protein
MATAPTAPPLTVHHLTDQDARLLLPGRSEARGLMYVVLDIPARTLYPYVPQTRDDHGPGRGVYFGEEDYLFVPPVIDFVLNLDHHPELAADVAALNALLDEVAPHAAELIDALAQGPDGAPDWSIRSRAIAEELRHRIDRRPYRGTQHDFPHEPGPLTTADELFAQFPQLVNPAWAEMDSDELDSRARRVLLDSLGLAPKDSEYHRRPRAVGIRTWMYAYRDRAGAPDQRTMDAAAWPGSAMHRAAVREDSTEAELEQASKAATAAAEAEGIRLIGAEKLMRNLREQRRTDIRAQLKAEGERVAELESQLNPAKRRRRALVTRILSWGLENDTDTTIARDAAMSHTAIGAIRASLNADTDNE